MDVSTIFIFFFITLGPVKAILPFAHVTTNADSQLHRQLSMTAFVVALVLALFTALVGKAIAAKWGVPTTAVAISGGTILFIWSLRALMLMQNPPAQAAPPTQPTREMAVMPIAVPTIITPAGIAAILYFTMSKPKGDWRAEAIIIGLLTLVMVINLFSLLFAKWIIRILGGRATFLVIGAVLAVIQNALAVKILVQALRQSF